MTILRRNRLLCSHNIATFVWCSVAFPPTPPAKGTMSIEPPIRPFPRVRCSSSVCGGQVRRSRTGGPDLTRGVRADPPRARDAPRRTACVAHRFRQAAEPSGVAIHRSTTSPSSAWGSRLPPSIVAKAGELRRWMSLRLMALRDHLLARWATTYVWIAWPAATMRRCPTYRHGYRRGESISPCRTGPRRDPG